MNKDRTFMLMTAAIVALILASPQIIYYASEYKPLVGDESYYNLRMVEQMKSGYVPEDAVQKTPYSFDLFHYLASLLGRYTSIASRIIPIILGTLTIAAFYALLGFLGVEGDRKVYSLIILAVSPIFIFKFTSFNSEAFAFLFLLIGAMLYMRRSYFSILFLVPIVLINALYAIAIVIAMLLYFAFNKDTKDVLITNVVLMVVVAIAATNLLGFDFLVKLVPGQLDVSNLLVEFGALKGYSVILMGLAGIGMFTSWDRTWKSTAAYCMLVLLLVASFFYVDIRLTCAAMLGVFGGIAISYMSARRWNILLVKNMTLLLVLCSLIFSFLVFLNTEVYAKNDLRIEAIMYLSASDSEDIVLSAERNGYMIEYLAGRQSYLDGHSHLFPDYEQRQSYASQIFYSRNLAELEKLLQQTGITHILIDSGMREGEIWSGREEGALFLFAYSNKFVRIFDNGEAQIYRYIQSN